MVRQYEESRRSRMAVVLAVAEAEYADADEFELAVGCAASLGLRAVRDARDVDDRRRAPRSRVSCGAGCARSRTFPRSRRADARRLQRRRPAREHDAGRGGLPAHRRGGRAAVDRVRGRRLHACPSRACSRPPSRSRSTPRWSPSSAMSARTRACRRSRGSPCSRSARSRTSPASCCGGRPRERDRMPASAPARAPRSCLACWRAPCSRRSSWSSPPSRRGRSTARGHFALLVAVGVAVAAVIAVVAWRRPGAAAGGGRARRWRSSPGRSARRAVSRLGGARRPAAGSRRSGHRRGPRLEGPRHGRPAGRLVPQPARARARGLPRSARARCSCCPGATTRIAYAAAPIAIGMVSFGLFFGRTTVSAPLAPRPDPPLRARRDRRSASPHCSRRSCGSPGARATSGSARSQRAAASSGVRVSRAGPRGRPAARRPRRAACRGRARRSPSRRALRRPRRRPRRPARGGGPGVDLARAVSPLAEYRAPVRRRPRRRRALHRRRARAALPERVRLATLDSVRRRGLSAAAAPARTRPHGSCACPSVLDAGAGHAGARPRSRSTASPGSGCRPPAGSRRSTSRGARASALADRFYYSAAAAAGVQTAGGGLERGRRLRRLGGVERPRRDLADDQRPRRRERRAWPRPRVSRTWVEQHATGSGGAALAGLVTLLRERGYLSHGLSMGDHGGRVDAGAPRLQLPAERLRALARPDRRAVHAPARRARRIRGPRHPATTSRRSATTSSSPSRWRSSRASSASPRGSSLGARLSSADAGLPTCQDGACRAQDLAAWTEVQSSDGDWVPIDVTPQYAQSPSLDVTEQRDPENVTEVRPDSAEAVVPPEPVQDDSATHDDSGPGGRRRSRVAVADAADLRDRAARRRARVRAVPHRHRGEGRPAPGAPADGDPARPDRRRLGRICGCRDSTPAATPRVRSPASELAATLATASGGELAQSPADQAVFSGADAHRRGRRRRFWKLVDSERRQLARGAGFWRRARRDRIVEIVHPSRGTRPRVSEAHRREGEAPGCASPCASRHDTMVPRTSPSRRSPSSASSCSTSGSRSRSPRVFRKSGEESWQAWVPVLNLVVLLRLGGLSGWLLLLGARAVPRPGRGLGRHRHRLPPHRRARSASARA